MQIHRLQLENWRNYHQTEAIFDPSVNIVYGANAQGKTNLLEAIAYLGMASSFRTANDLELINKQSRHFYLHAEVSSERQGRLEIAAAMNREKKRKWVVNGQPRRRLVEIIGLFHTVVFSPEDIYLVKGGPGCRRRWLNRQISQLDPAYCRRLVEYNHILRQRNAYLKNGAPDEDTLAVWDEQLIACGVQISLRRRQIIAELNRLAAPLHRQLASGERLELRYLSQSAPPEAEEAELAELFRAQLLRHRRAELLRGVTLAGPHRDDILVLINDDQAREFASQGQQRSLALSLKLAELELAYQERGEYPVLLLDDVLSELDSQRGRRILELPAKTQTFISAAALPQARLSGKRWLVQSIGGTARLSEKTAENS